VRYLADHLAGSVYAVELGKTLRDEHSHDSLGQFAAAIPADIEADKEVLQKLSERVGTGLSGLKEVTAWLGDEQLRGGGLEAILTYSSPPGSKGM
jgi:hypothetical protein